MTQDMQPITEADIADWLSHNPGFFERHAELLATVQLASPHGGRAVSLQERQAEMLREKIKGLERRLMDMIRHGNENGVIADRLHRWTLSLLLANDPGRLPALIADGVCSEFQVPQAAIRVWGVSPAWSAEAFATGVSDDAKSFASSLTAPYCGVNPGFEAAGWLPEPAMALSMALIPLRPGPTTDAATAPAFGMLVLASPDPKRFEAGMGTDFLERIAELASAALSRLR